MRKLILIALLALVLCGCQEMKQGEHGVVFSELPGFLGGGVKKKLVEPGEVEIIFPWERLYRIDTTVKYLFWGKQEGEGSHEDFVETRALDGNEVGLGVTVRYRIDPKRIHHVVQRVGTSEDSIRKIVEVLARADIRTHMNTLRTADFFSPERRQAAVERVKHALETRLSPEGVIVEDVIYNEHRFERRLGENKIDRSYQEQIDRTQALNEETQQEENKVASVVEQKKREFNEAQGRVNRVIESADGAKRQAILRGDGYLAAKKNEAEQIRTTGLAQVEGLKKQVEALKGPGGQALLKLAIVQQLIANNPKFIVINSGEGGKGNIDLNKIDTNALIEQAELFVSSPEILKDSPAGKRTLREPQNSEASEALAPVSEPSGDQQLERQ
jgi:hypothetical protein